MSDPVASADLVPVDKPALDIKPPSHLTVVSPTPTPQAPPLPPDVCPAPRATTPGRDGKGIFPPAWQPHFAAPQPAKPPRFPEGPAGRPRGGTTVPHATGASQGRDEGAPRSGAAGSLDGDGTLAGGSHQAPPVRGSGNAAQPLFAPPVVTAYQSTSRKVRDSSPHQRKDDYDDAQQRRYDRLQTERKIVPGTPTGGCLRYCIDDEEGGDVVDRGGQLGLSGVKRCGLRACVWDNARILQEDCEEAVKYLLGWVKRKNAIAMVHFTMRHTADEAWIVTWNAHNKVLDRLHHGKRWDCFKAEWGLLEYGYGNETPDGVNGWHRHQHRDWEIQWRDEFRTAAGRRAWAARFQEAYEALYIDALHKEGRDALPGIALHVTLAAPTMANARKAAEYVTKFAKEATLGPEKLGRQGSRSPFELLDDAADKTLSDAQRARARARFKEFYDSSKNKRWKYWSESRTDPAGAAEEPEIPDQTDDRGVPVLHFTGFEWKVLDYTHKLMWLFERIKAAGPDVARAELTRLCDPLYWSKRWARQQGPAPPEHYRETYEEGF